VSDKYAFIAAERAVGVELVRKLMRELGLIPVQPRPFRNTTIRDVDQPYTVDLVRRDFTADRLGTKAVGDVTYIRKTKMSRIPASINVDSG
jgi:putative transposase